MSCLFDSLSAFLKISSFDLRQQICDYIENNPNLLDGLDINEITKIINNMNITTYIENMRNPKTWGSALEIKAFCEIYNIKIIISHSDRDIEFLPNDGNYLYTLFLNYSGNHFTPHKLEKK